MDWEEFQKGNGEGQANGPFSANGLGERGRKMGECLFVCGWGALGGDTENGKGKWWV